MFVISVIIPIYNVQDYIERCVDSIIAQECDDFQLECIMVNDCTPDDSMEVLNRKLKDYVGTIEFVIINHESNRGLSAARNTGISCSHGDFVYFVDSDDRLADGALKYLLEGYKKYSEGSNVDFVMGNACYCKEAKPIMNLNVYEELLLDNSEGEVLRYLFEKRLFHSAWNKLVRRDFLIKNKLFFENGIIIEDLLWSYFLFLHSGKVLVLPKNTYYYEDTPGSIINTISERTSLVIFSRVTICNKILDSPPNFFLIQYYMFIYHQLIKIVDVYNQECKHLSKSLGDSVECLRTRFLNEVQNKRLLFCYLFFLTSRRPFYYIIRCRWYRRYFDKIERFVIYISRKK